MEFLKEMASREKETIKTIEDKNCYAAGWSDGSSSNWIYRTNQYFFKL
jgi:hypothetical protein